MGSPSPHHSHKTVSLGFGVLTTTDRRTAGEDESGKVLKELIEVEGHHVIRSGLCPNRVPEIQSVLRAWVADPAVNVVISSGGTGFGPRDVTIDALEQLGGRKIDSFGERFRALSYEQVGILALMSRSALYLVDRHPVFALPGSPKACRLAVKDIILPFVPHLVGELEKP